MNKLFFAAIFAFFGFSNIQAQGVSFGVTGGLLYGSVDASLYGFSIKEISDLTNYDLGDLETLDGGGFYAGFLVDIEFFDKFHAQPELLYANVGGESMVIVPVMAKYYIAGAFNIQAGLQLDFLLDPPSFDIQGIELAQLVKSNGFSINVGAGYDFSDKIALQAKYSFGTTNRINESDVADLLESLGFVDLGGIFSDFLNRSSSLKNNILQVGVVYKF